MDTLTIEAIRNLDLPPGTWCVVGGAVFDAYGIRPLGQHDIDILVTSETFAQQEASNNQWESSTQAYDGAEISLLSKIIPGVHLHLPVELLKADSFVAEIPNIYEYILTPVYFYDIPFISIENMIEWKRIAGRSKDRKDIKLYEAWREFRPISETPTIDKSGSMGD